MDDAKGVGGGAMKTNVRSEGYLCIEAKGLFFGSWLAAVRFTQQE